MDEDDAVLESEISKLSLAVYLKDEYSKGDAIGDISVSIKGLEKKPLKNQGSNYLFLDLPQGKYAVSAKPGRYGHYFDADSGPVDVPPQRPVGSPGTPPPPPWAEVTITLQPKPSYSFPPGETMIRGILWEKDNDGKKPVPNATLSWAGRKAVGRTTEKGEFVIYFMGSIEPVAITSPQGEPPLKTDKSLKWYVKGDQGTALEFEVTRASTSGSGSTAGSATIMDVEVGETNLIDMMLSA